MPTKEQYWKNREKLLKQEAARYKRERTRILARNKVWNAAHPEVMNKITKEWAEANPERRDEIVKKSYKKNKKKRNAACRNYAKQHPDVIKAKTQRRRARRKNAEGSFTSAEWIALCEKYGNRCLCCGRTKKQLKTLGLALAPDHVIPLSKGGSNYISNIQPLCHAWKKGSKGGCNNAKRAKTIDYRRMPHARQN